MMGQRKREQGQTRRAVKEYLATLDDIAFFALSICRNYNRNRLTDRHVRSVAEYALGTPVPACDNAVEVLAYNRIVTVLDNCPKVTQPLLAVAKLGLDTLAFSNIAIDLKHGVVAKQLHAAIDNNLTAVLACMA
jgi:hypothetical protein